MLFSIYSFMIPVRVGAVAGEIIKESRIPLRLHYDEQTPYGNENAYQWPSNLPDDGWDKWSLPIGNGYFGVNVFWKDRYRARSDNRKNARQSLLQIPLISEALRTPGLPPTSFSKNTRAETTAPILRHFISNTADTCLSHPPARARSPQTFRVPGTDIISLRGARDIGIT